MVGIRGAAVVVTAVAVTATLLSGCELVATGRSGRRALSRYRHHGARP